jgi:hypothetical protein
MTEPGNDAGDNFSVAMLTDQHMRPGPAIPEGNHQLLGMPEGQNDGSFLSIQRIHRLIAALLQPHTSLDPTDHQSSERRQYGQLKPSLYVLLHAHLVDLVYLVCSVCLVTCYLSPVTQHLHIRHILKLHRMQPLIQTVVP